MTQWSKLNYDSPERTEMFEELIEMMKNCQLKSVQHSMVPFDNYLQALSNAMTTKGMAGQKFILDFQN